MCLWGRASFKVFAKSSKVMTRKRHLAVSRGYDERHFYVKSIQICFPKCFETVTKMSDKSVVILLVGASLVCSADTYK